MDTVDYTRHNLLHDELALETEPTYFGRIDETTSYVGPRSTKNLSTAERLCIIALDDIVNDLKYEAAIGMYEDLEDTHMSYSAALHSIGPLDRYDVSNSFFSFAAPGTALGLQYMPAYSVPKQVILQGEDPTTVALQLRRSRVKYFVLRKQDSHHTLKVLTLKSWLTLFETEAHTLEDTTLYDLETGRISLHPVSSHPQTTPQ